jgi:hypothetical protein
VAAGRRQQAELTQTARLAAAVPTHEALESPQVHHRTQAVQVSIIMSCAPCPTPMIQMSTVTSTCHKLRGLPRSK